MTLGRTPPFKYQPNGSDRREYAFPVTIECELGIICQRQDPDKHLQDELATPKISNISKYLWLAGLPRPARPLHRQRLLGREFRITLRPDEHLVWHESLIFVKPLPEFLLSTEFWETKICPDEQLYSHACGLLMSYVWLVRHNVDFQMAQELSLLPRSIDWKGWRHLVEEFLDNVDASGLHQVAPRYQYGELRLSRLDLIYGVTSSFATPSNLLGGFIFRPSWSQAFFKRHFAWVLTLMVFMTVVLSALQVGLASSRLEGHRGFQEAAGAMAVVALVGAVGIAVTMLLIWVVLFCYFLFGTMRRTRRVMRERRQRVYVKGGP